MIRKLGVSRAHPNVSNHTHREYSHAASKESSTIRTSQQMFLVDTSAQVQRLENMP